MEIDMQMNTTHFRIGRIAGLLPVLALTLGLCACERGSTQNAHARELAQITQVWTEVQQALDAGDLPRLKSLFHPRVLDDYAKAPELMIKIRSNGDLADLVRGDIRAAIIDPPLALVSTATDALLDTPVDWVWFRTDAGWKLVGNRDAVNLMNLVSGKGPLIRQDEE
jgi:hypothetical protein